MLEAWAAPFSDHFQGRSSICLYELAIVEGVVSKSCCPKPDLLLQYRWVQFACFLLSSDSSDNFPPPPLLYNFASHTVSAVPNF